MSGMVRIAERYNGYSYTREGNSSSGGRGFQHSPRRRRKRKPPYLAIGLVVALLLATVVFAWRAVSARIEVGEPSTSSEKQSGPMDQAQRDALGAQVGNKPMESKSEVEAEDAATTKEPITDDENMLVANEKSASKDEASSKVEADSKAESDLKTQSEPQENALPAGGEPKQVGDTGDALYEAELPMLVNATNYIPDGHTPNIVPLGNGYSLESRAAEAWNALMKGAQRDGINLWVISAYRSHERQVENFNNKVQEYKNRGYADEEAYLRTAEYIAVPGTSEHSLGYAVDFCSLEESFESTKAGRWLYENCDEYGFILRYPKDKEDITKIKYEPWHFRYVGTNHASEIMRRKICLEEYLGKLN